MVDRLAPDLARTLGQLIGLFDLLVGPERDDRDHDQEQEGQGEDQNQLAGQGPIEKPTTH